ncbi:MAG: orotidine-5'-phosphate decarboxylase [Bacteroidales bacterium]|nr:orotidine-5'-phosphate decarboxylase [Bacteroidales bacterium]
MTRQELIKLIKTKQSFLCVGLDSDISKLPKCVLDSEDAVFEFNKRIIDATLPYTVAYKPNLAFYESYGIKGLISLKKTMDYLHAKAKGQCFVIADAKRGDIGNTSKQYAKAFFTPEGDFDFDALTVAPYMGQDSVSPFLEYAGKWVIVLALTSNKGSDDFQLFENTEKTKLYQHVLSVAQRWGSKDNTMFVCGATKADMFTDIRRIVPEHFLLVPGVGAQGGDLEQVCRYGMNKDCGLLVNSSRGIIFADNGNEFDTAAKEKAMQMQTEMASYLKNL